MLTLHDDDGAQLVRLRSDVGPPLEGVTWQAFAYRDGPIGDKQAVVPVVEGSTITVEFDGAETLSGRPGATRTRPTTRWPAPTSTSELS